MRAWPGEIFSIGIVGVDDYGHNTTTTAKLSFEDHKVNHAFFSFCEWLLLAYYYVIIYNTGY